MATDVCYLQGTATDLIERMTQEDFFKFMYEMDMLLGRKVTVINIQNFQGPTDFQGPIEGSVVEQTLLKVLQEVATAGK
ncbi:hypothetical protein CJD36_020045 [Flavipsychrobacter stenotrophus]|uniref:Uncharacterized protein n=2 Tax=Flavipsychrobacter stenotrophus TaxID=2077091 RepID=A0A2S7SRJ7_9BACT|nr:hypothetical protein CJD36_020045 [Flavipsychrobacter stenotrophus]